MSEPINGHRPDPRKDFHETIRQAVTETVKAALEQFPSAYLVLLDDGQVSSGHFDFDSAERKAKDVGGVVVSASIMADHREGRRDDDQA